MCVSLWGAANNAKKQASRASRNHWYKEVGPLGIKVTIVEPGGFRTDFTGISTDLREGRAEYDPTVGATEGFQRDYDGKQPGGPAKAAAAFGTLRH
jgi:NAD(P)-dependent dehydrogenase (short-subunit alcohol dehydrogenase family)